MQDLRLVGVHDDGGYLLLSGAGGEKFRLSIDEALRVAVSRSAKAASGPGAEPVAMSPRDIQARIRSGATAAEVAEVSGMPLAKVQRYEGPVLAEREHVAMQARKVEVAAPSPGHDVYRSVFGDNPATLGDMVAHRLTAHGVAPSSVEWDSWRRPDGNWNVVARFEAQPGGHPVIGEEPPAMWTFNPARKSLQNANRWAQQLSELEPLDGPVPPRRLSAVADRPFDFETDADAAARNATAQLSVIQQLLQDRSYQENAQQDKDPNGLLDMLRSRRGQRLGLEDADDALAVLLANGVPAAHPRPSEVIPEQEQAAEAETEQEQEPRPAPAAAPDLHAVEAPVAPDKDATARRRDGRPSMVSPLTLAPHLPEGGDDALKLLDGVSTETREITFAASQLRPLGQGNTPSKGLDELIGGGTSRRQQRESPAAAGTGREAEQPERQPGKPKRSSVPSWDEIVFGTRND